MTSSWKLRGVEEQRILRKVRLKEQRREWRLDFFRLEWVRSLCGLDQPLFSLRPNDLSQFFISEAEERSSLHSFPVASLRAFYAFRWFSFSFSLSRFWSQRSSLLSLYEPLVHDRIRNKIVVVLFHFPRSSGPAWNRLKVLVRSLLTPEEEEISLFFLLF